MQISLIQWAIRQRQNDNEKCWCTCYTWWRRYIAGPEDALVKAEEMGYPVMLKASAGGGGRGMRLVKESSDVIRLSNLQIKKLSPLLEMETYIEKFIQNPRHIEVQILADSYGNAIHLGERECSIQRRHQKLIEESPHHLWTQLLEKNW